ncbi:DNA-binding transcriptional regulator OxyR [Echinimonas agarilytica]|uniref:DNA-binding transcriptional regulator OxyR n=1 Tax=Echinimonas agarilytica TaxID=1215918 RepID=A0AA41W421_9GAMM|nr:DNA-binding transcriptional regulator OxyR [Echinimonas agarilytica]MCM2678335.1 DNA-binding transcriptional regulator OxyR [Echinimonas agarilytica]
MSMNLRDLEYLSALYDERHFRKAAERCFVSQPTLSGQIRKLEDELNITLIERDTRNVMFTSAGESIVNRARRVLDEVKSLKDTAQSFRDPMSGDLRVGLIPTVAPYLLPKMMPALFSECPNIKWQLEEQQTNVLLNQLKEGQIDALILAWLPEMEGLGHISLYDEPLYLASASGHELMSRDCVELDELDGQMVLMLEDGHCLRDQAMGYCFSAGAKEDGTFRATSLETLRHMVATGRGVTLMPYLAIEQNTQASDMLSYRPFSDPQPAREIALVYRRGTSRIRTLQAIANVIKQSVTMPTA